MYSAICVALGRCIGGAGLSDARRRPIDSAVDGMILMVAGLMALSRDAPAESWTVMPMSAGNATNALLFLVAGAPVR